MPKPPGLSETLGDRNAHRVAINVIAQLISSVRAALAQERRDAYERNKPRIRALERLLAYLYKKHAALIQQIEPLLYRIANAPRPSIWNLVGAISFALVGFALAWNTTKEFHLGIAGEVFAFGLALLLPCATHRFIRRFGLYKYVGAIFDLVVFLTATATIVAFSGIRVDVFNRQMNPEAALVLEGVNASLSPSADTFDKIGVLFSWALVCASLGFEFLSGLLGHEFVESRTMSNSSQLQRLEKELLKVEQKILTASLQLQELLAEPGETHMKRWADFRQGLWEAVAQAGEASGRIGRSALLIVVALISTHTLVAGEKLHIIAEVDLSITENAIAFGERSQFDENMLAISRLCSVLPAGARLSVLAITDQTIATPFVILSARLSEEEGYFGSRLAKGRRDLIAEWTKRTKNLKATAPHTDVLGGFAYASEIFAHSTAERKVLVFVSDMRHEQPGVLDLEKPEVIDVTKSINNVDKRGMILPLKNVQVYVFGVGDHSGKKRPEYTSSLKAFYVEYARRTGATLRRFSTTWDPDGLAEAGSVGMEKGGVR